MSIVIEIDDKVRGSLGGAADWNSMLYRRQLTGALFREQADGSPRPGLLTVVDIPDDQTMVAAVSEDARCASGEPPTIEQIAEALYKSSQGRSEFFLFNLLSRIRVRNRYLEVTSRVPGIDIAQLMSSPHFGISGDGDKSTAAFRVRRSDSNERLRFQPVIPHSDSSRSTEDIEVVVSQSPEHALTMFHDGAIDMTCPTSLSQSVWKEWDRNGQVKNLRSNPRLLIGVSLLLPPHLKHLHDVFDKSIDRARVARSVHDNIYPASNWFEVWNYTPSPVALPSGNPTEKHAEVDTYTYTGSCVDPDTPLAIEYAAFTPNHELATELARQLSIFTSHPVTPRKINYSILLDQPRQSNAIRLILRFFPWAHPAAMLYPSLADPQSSHLLGTACPDPASLFEAYQQQQRLQGEIVVGGLRSAMLTTLKAFESPPTGWFDFADLSRQHVRGPHS